ncbi:OmpA family protein [Erythrobacter sp. THAF29]|uniref:OmpA family protein n=1 Tax=Erythrobacter sp. THAF29 TaxID=2587851 RepID=UPI0015621065|nr:OmpA family protein [Erythrobacter sp. THAF29]
MKTTLISALTITGIAMPAALSAQDVSSDLSTSDIDALEGAIQMRYDAALAATRDSSVISANDPRYIWATEAKAQCAIALGYLKSDTRDEPSISKCDRAYRLMTVVPTPPPPPAPPAPPTPPRSEVCDDRQPGIVFFEFDSETPGSGAGETIRFLADNAQRCGWSSFTVVGHTDRAGSNAYNESLSMRRAMAVADLMANLGINRSQMRVRAEGESNPRVPTADGIRSPENRRVEVTVVM